MEAIVSQILKVLMPYAVRFILDHRQVVITFLKNEAKKTDNRIDDYVVDILEEYINKL